MSFKPALEFHNRTIDKLVTEVEQQKDLLLIVKSALPTNLAEHTLHSVVHDETLFIYTDAAIWSSQLRFYQNTILTVVSSSIQNSIKRIQIRLK